MEHDARREQGWATWETDLDDYEAVAIPGAGFFAEVVGNTHQAMWMATREQVGGWGHASVVQGLRLAVCLPRGPSAEASHATKQD